MRIRRADPGLSDPRPSERLLRRAVSDWLTEAELVAMAAEPEDPHWQRPATPWQTRAQVAAWHRHAHARIAWLREHRIPGARWAEVLPPVTPIRWVYPRSFAAASGVER